MVLQAHLCARASSLCMPVEPKLLLREIRDHLVSACDDGLLAMKPHDVFARLKLKGSPLGEQPEYMGIYGGDKDLKRTGQRPRFLRRDGAWFVFTITIRKRDAEALELYAYDFELCFPKRDDLPAPLPRFVRFDLNQPGHDNQTKGLRCHTHPGHDDLMAPAPLMSPIELLDLFLNDALVLPERPRKA